jgi:hypothetical protein
MTWLTVLALPVEAMGVDPTPRGYYTNVLEYSCIEKVDIAIWRNDVSYHQPSHALSLRAWRGLTWLPAGSLRVPGTVEPTIGGMRS